MYGVGEEENDAQIWGRRGEVEEEVDVGKRGPHLLLGGTFPSSVGGASCVTLQHFRL